MRSGTCGARAKGSFDACMVYPWLSPVRGIECGARAMWCIVNISYISTYIYHNKALKK